MSAVGSMLGVNGGAGGTGFATPSGVNINQTTTAYNDVQNSIAQQNSFVNALAGLNGVGNQGQVYSQLANIAAGQGPNPAQAMLNQATGANVAATTAAMAGNRGANANVGLIGRQAAQQGAATQQQAAGQAATMQANQSLGALSTMGNLATTEVGQQQGAMSGVANTALGQQGNLLGLQGNVNTANANMANIRMGQQPNMLGSVGGAGMGIASLAEGGKVPHYDEGGSVASNPITAASPNVTPPAAPASNPQGPKSNIAKYFNNTGSDQGQAGKPSDSNSFSSGFNSTFNAVRGAFGPGQTNSPSAITSQNQQSENQLQNQLLQHGSFEGKSTMLPAANDAAGPAAEAGALPGASSIAPELLAVAAKGGKASKKVPALVSPGEVYLDKKDLAKVKKGANPLKVGEHIPGKAKVPGAVNSYKNDTVSKNLDEGGVVVPRSVTQQPKSTRDKKAHDFVSQYLAQGGKVKGMVIFSSKKAK